MKEINQIKPKVETEAPLERQEIKPEIRVEKKQEEMIGQTEIKKETTPPPSSSAPVKNQASDLQKLDRNNQVKQLCEIAFTQGLDNAIEIAKKLDNAYVLDELHDSLVDKLYKRLVEENKLKQI